MRSANTVDALWGCDRDAVISRYALWGLRADATAFSGVFKIPHCTVIMLLLWTYSTPKALIQIAMGTTSHGAYFVNALSARHGIASYETSRGAVEMPWRSLSTLGDPTVRTSAFWVFLAGHAVAVRTPPWCDRGFRKYLFCFRRRSDLHWACRHDSF